MADIKACDLHPNAETRNHAKDSSKTIVIQQWMKVEGKNKLFENKLDVCPACLSSQILERAKALGVDIEKNWKTEVWQTGSSGKKYSTMMSHDEVIEHMKKEAQEKELAELRALKSGAK